MPLAPSLAVTVDFTPASGVVPHLQQQHLQQQHPQRPQQQQQQQQQQQATRSPRLDRAIERFTKLMISSARGISLAREATLAAQCGAQGAVLPCLRAVAVHVSDISESLDIDTDYSYTLSTHATEEGTVRISAPRIYGAMYALETLAQLIDVERGTPAFMDIKDAPAYPWRGLLVDTGRRFVPLPLLRNIIDTMAAVKLNVLHLHLTDFCRFGVESRLFPQLTASLGPGSPNAGFYSQKEVKALVEYAGDRGVRVVPEFEASLRCLTTP